MTKVKYGLFVSRDCFTITLAERGNDPSFTKSYEGFKLLEIYECETWEEAVSYLNKRELEHYQRLPPDEVWNESDIKEN